MRITFYRGTECSHIYYDSQQWRLSSLRYPNKSAVMITKSDYEEYPIGTKTWKVAGANIFCSVRLLLFLPLQFTLW